MSKYMIKASYTAEGIKGLQKDKATGRQQVVGEAIKALGGRLEVMYYALGEDDVIVIADMPNNQSVASLCFAVCAAGLARTTTMALMTVEETDQALQTSVSYRAPGR